jgi:hypothetical protein
VTAQCPMVDGELGDGAFGPTILLTPRSHDGVERLRVLFALLAASNPGIVVNLVEEAGFDLGASIWSLRLQVTDSRPIKHLVRGKDGGFTWSGTSDDWETASLLVEPLLRQSGHQYLTDEAMDDAIVEVSYGEHQG